MMKFDKFAHHVIFNDEMVIFDEMNDDFIFLSDNETLSLVTTLNIGNDSIIAKRLYEQGVLEKSDHYVDNKKLNYMTSKKFGIDNYEWRTSKKYRDTKINKSRKLYSAALLICNLSMEIIGFHKTLQIARNIRNSFFRVKKNRSDENPIHIVSNFDVVSKFLPFKNTCLEYALTSYAVLTLLNYEPKFYIGLQKYDFLSHAWIEIDGKVIGDVPDLKDKLHIILSI